MYLLLSIALSDYCHAVPCWDSIFISTFKFESDLICFLSAFWMCWGMREAENCTVWFIGYLCTLRRDSSCYRRRMLHWKPDYTTPSVLTASVGFLRLPEHVLFRIGFLNSCLLDIGRITRRNASSESLRMRSDQGVFVQEDVNPHISLEREAVM